MIAEKKLRQMINRNNMGLRTNAKNHSMHNSMLKKDSALNAPLKVQNDLIAIQNQNHEI